MKAIRAHVRKSFRTDCWLWWCDCSVVHVYAADSQPKALAAALAHIRTHHQPEETK